MNKTTFFIILFFATGFVAFSTFISPFTTWDDVITGCPDIVIAKCTWAYNSKPYKGKVIILNGGFPSDIEVLTVLKGNTKPGPSHLMSGYWPYPDQQFVILGGYHNDRNFTGYDAEQIIPISRYFPLGSLNGKTLDEQMQIIFSNRLVDVNAEINQDDQDKLRLEQYLKAQQRGTSN